MALKSYSSFKNTKKEKKKKSEFVKKPIETGVKLGLGLLGLSIGLRALN